MDDKLSLKEILEVFVKVVQELEKRLLFPSLLMDIPVQCVGTEVTSIFKGSADCREAYRTLISVKDQLTSEIRRQWQVLDEPSALLECDLGSKLREFHNGLQSACASAAKLDFKYRSVVGGLSTPCIGDHPSVYTTMQQDIFSVISEFESKINEIEQLILVPSMLCDIQDRQITDCLNHGGLHVEQYSSLRDIYILLRTIRDQVCVPRAKLSFGESETAFGSKTQKLYILFKELVNISYGIMLKYTTELERSTGEKESPTQDQFSISTLQWDLGRDLLMGRSAFILDRVEEAMKVA